MSGNETNPGAPVGAAEMEAEHELLTRILHDLFEALTSGAPNVPALLAQLDDATNAHFLQEQLTMRLHAFPGYAAHQLEHDRLIGELRALREEIGGGALDDAALTAKRLEGWLMDHMHTADEAFGIYLRQAGIRPRPSA